MVFILPERRSAHARKREHEYSAHPPISREIPFDESGRVSVEKVYQIRTDRLLSGFVFTLLLGGDYTTGGVSKYTKYI